MKKYFIAMIFIPIVLQAHSLKERFQGAKPGDFVTCELNNSYNLLRIHENKGDTIVLEEITFPSTLLKKGKIKKGVKGWQTWINGGADGHTSWILLELDLKEGRVVECFSFYRNAWLVLSEEDSFLLKLLTINLQPLPKERRRKIGPPPREGFDTRRIWNPPLVFNGKTISKPEFDTYEVNWPKDGTPLAAKRLEFYFDHSHPEFPFPYWGKVANAADAAYKFRVIDSGTGLETIQKEIPKKP